MKNSQAGISWKKDAREVSQRRFEERNSGALQSFIYGEEDDDDKLAEEEEDDDYKEGNEDDDDDDFFRVKRIENVEDDEDDDVENKGRGNGSDGQGREEDSSKVRWGGGFEESLRSWMGTGEDCRIESIRDKFVTGNWEGSGDRGGGDGESDGDDDDDDSGYGSFEDLEAGGGEAAPLGSGSYEDDGSDDSENEMMDSMMNSIAAAAGNDNEAMREYNASLKAKKKMNFDAEYDRDKLSGKRTSSAANGGQDEEEDYLDVARREKEEKLRRTASEFNDEGIEGRVKHEGYRQGLYCRIKIPNVPVEFLKNFNPANPTILGGLLPSECHMGLVRCRFKKHRWFEKILKCGDPLVVSCGWRR